MFDEIISLDNLFAAWREFRRGKRGKPDVQHFERHLEDELFSLRRDLSSRVYRHGPYRRFNIFDPKPRVIHKAMVRDRVVHHAICRVLGPVIESRFINDSYSCRRGKGTHLAIRVLERFARRVSLKYRGPCWALKCDIRKFFDNIDHGALLEMLDHWVSDSGTRWLLREIVESFRIVDKNRERAIGVPIGNLTSQLFANLYLNDFDHFIKEKLRAKYYLRYTDDFMVVHHNPVALASLVPVMRTYLQDQLFLELHPKKIVLRKLRQGIDFLGYVQLPHYRRLRTRTKQRMFKKLMRMDGSEFVRVQSYLGMIQHCNGRGLAWQVKMVYANNHNDSWGINK